jgi:dephospho-CoA kinase
LDNNGTLDELITQVDALWQDRILGFNDNLLTGGRSHRPDTPTLVPYVDSWPSTATRLIGRITLALKAAGLGQTGVAVEHIGSTSVPGLPAKDVIDIQVGVSRLSDADRPEFVKALADRGFPRADGSNNNNHQDAVHAWAPDPASWAKRFHGSADPGRVTHLHVREQDSAGWKASLLFRDWLVANPPERDEYADLKRALARTETTTTAYTLAKEPWIDGALGRARVWARSTGWRPE